MTDDPPSVCILQSCSYDEVGVDLTYERTAASTSKQERVHSTNVSERWVQPEVHPVGGWLTAA